MNQSIIKNLCLGVIVFLNALSHLSGQWVPVTNLPTQNILDVVWASDANTVFTVNKDFVYKSTNGGQTWQSQNLSPSTPFTNFFSAEDIHFFDAQNGIIVGDFILGAAKSFTTHDGGQTWQETSIPGTGPLIGGINVVGVRMVSPTVAFVVGSNGFLSKTVNGGQSWTRFSIPNAALGWTDIDFPDAQHGRLMSKDNKLYVTNDGGNSWIAYPTPVQSTAATIQFFNANDGYLIDYSGQYKTADGGQNWTRVADWITSTSYTYFFADPLNGWSAANGLIFKTTNGGLTWLIQYDANRPDYYRDIHFSGSVGWAAGAKPDGASALYKATNKGGFGMLIKADTNVLCNFQTTNFTCIHDGATAFEWKVDGIVMGNQAAFSFHPTTDGQFKITCTASDAFKSVSQTVPLNVYTEPVFPFTSTNQDSLCIGTDLTMDIGPLKTSYKYRIQRGNTILKEWSSTQNSLYSWHYGQLDTTTTFDFYAFFINCGWQKIHTRTIKVVPTPRLDFTMTVPFGAVCEKYPLSIRLNNSESFVNYQAWAGNQPVGPIATGGASPLIVTAKGLFESQYLRVLAASSATCKFFLRDSVKAVVMKVEPSFALSTQTIGTNEPLLVDNTSADSLSFLWQFSGATPNPQTSTAKQPPPVSFGTAGIGFVTLVVTTPFGCKDTLQKSVNVYDAALLGTTWAITHDMGTQQSFSIDSAGSSYAHTGITDGTSYAKSIRSRPSGEIFIYGDSLLFYKHDQRGVLQWYNFILGGRKTVNSASSKVTNIVDQYTDRQGNSFLLVNISHDAGLRTFFSSTDGRSVSTDENDCIALVQYSPFGVLRSIRFMESKDNSGDPVPGYIRGIALRRDDAGDIFLLMSANFASTVGHPLALTLTDPMSILDTATTWNAVGSYFLIKISDNKRFTWIQNVSDGFIGAGYGLTFVPLMIEPDRVGGCYVWSKGGTLRQTITISLAVQLARFDNIGTRSWFINRVITPGRYIYANDLTVDQAGNAYILGTSFGSGTFANSPSSYDPSVFVVKIGRNGAIKWENTVRFYQYGNSNDFDHRALGVAVDEENKVYVLSTLNGSRAFIDHPCVDSTFSGQANLLLTTWDSLGNLLQILPSKANRRNNYDAEQAKHHLRVQRGIIYAIGSFEQLDSHFLGVALPTTNVVGSFLARVPDPKNYRPYLNACQYQRCDRDSSTIRLQISYLFNQIQWYHNDTLLTGANQTTINPLLAGIYTARGNNPNNDSRVSPVSAVVKVYPFPRAVITQRDSSLVAPSYTEVTYRWYDSSGVFLAIGNPYYPKKTGWYRLEILSFGPCSDKSALFYFNKTVGLNDIGYKKMDMLITPNPNVGIFNIELFQTVIPRMIFRITDIAGRLVMEKQLNVGNQTQTIEARFLPDGLYFLHLVSDGKVVAVKKFVKQ
jgi:photosystem II stability/assembly factor-like uncharacterized protein